MAKHSVDWENGYKQGFYTALKGTRYIATTSKSYKDVIEGIDDAIDAMRRDGDLENVDTGVDKLLELMEVAEKAGIAEKFMDEIEKSLK